MDKSKVICPECGERAGVRIVWGLPHPDEMDRDDVVFGGCVLPLDPPDRRCQECGHSWRRHRAEP